MGKAHTSVLSRTDLDLVLGPAIYWICELEESLPTDVDVLLCRAGVRRKEDTTEE